MRIGDAYGWRRGMSAMAGRCSVSKNEIACGQIQVPGEMDGHVRRAVAVDVDVNVGGAGLLVVTEVELPRVSREGLDHGERVVRTAAFVGVDRQKIDLVAALLAAD